MAIRSNEHYKIIFGDFLEIRSLDKILLKSKNVHKNKASKYLNFDLYSIKSSVTSTPPRRLINRALAV